MSVVDLYKIISDYDFVKIVGAGADDTIYYGLNLNMPEYLLSHEVLKLSKDKSAIVIYV